MDDLRIYATGSEDRSLGYFNELCGADDDFLAVASEEPQKKLNLANQVSWEANMNHFHQNQLARALYTQPNTSSGVNKHMLNQENNSPSPQPSTLRAQKKRLADKVYRQRIKLERIQLESNLRELVQENKDLRRKNESLTQQKDLAGEESQQAHCKTKQLRSEMGRLRHQHDHLRILVDAYAQKTLRANDNVYEQRSQLEVELNGLIEKIGWQDWMTEKLHLLERFQLLQKQNKILNVQVQALCEMRYKRQHSELENTQTL